MGFHLTAGCFFPLIAGGHLLYRSAPNGDQIDYTLPVGVAGPAAASVTEFAFSPHAADASYRYGLRAIARCGAEETNTGCMTEVQFDSAGDQELPRPNAPYDLQARPLSTTQTQLTWRYDPTGQAVEPLRFGFFANGWPLMSPFVSYSPAVQVYTAILTHSYATTHRFLVYAASGEGRYTGCGEVWAAYDEAVPPMPAAIIIERSNA